MTVARVAQDEVDAVRREMQDKLKAAQDCVERQVSGGNRGGGLDEQEKREAWFWGIRAPYEGQRLLTTSDV